MKQTTLDTVLQIFDSLNGLDVQELRCEIPKVLKHALRTKSAHWLELEDVMGQGKLESAGRSNRLIESRLRQQVANGLRENLITWTDTKFSYIEVQLSGRLGYLIVERQLSAGWMKAFKRILQNLWKSASKLQEAKDRAFIDDVTQLYNQRYLHLVLEKEIRRSEREKQAFSVLFIDVDHFKNVNDTAGHLVGSKLLGEVAEILRRHTRLVDFAFRYGGDEFVLILVGTDAQEAQEVGERIRMHVDQASFVVDEVPVKLTISIGVAAFPKHAATKEEILRMADEAMYQSKNRSRNSVSIAG